MSQLQIWEMAKWASKKLLDPSAERGAPPQEEADDGSTKKVLLWLRYGYPLLPQRK